MRIGVRMPERFADAGEFLADVRALEAAGADALWLHAATAEHLVLLGAIGALTGRIRLRILDPAAPVEVLQKITGGRIDSGPAEGEWEDVPMPADRASWTALLSEREAAGAAGIVVPWDARLIDLLRNPGEQDRSDLMMSTG